MGIGAAAFAAWYVHFLSLARSDEKLTAAGLMLLEVPLSTGARDCLFLSAFRAHWTNMW